MSQPRIASLYSDLPPGASNITEFLSFGEVWEYCNYMAKQLRPWVFEIACVNLIAVWAHEFGNVTASPFYVPYELTQGEDNEAWLHKIAPESDDLDVPIHVALSYLGVQYDGIGEMSADDGRLIKTIFAIKSGYLQFFDIENPDSRCNMLTLMQRNENLASLESSLRSIGDDQCELQFTVPAYFNVQIEADHATDALEQMLSVLEMHRHDDTPLCSVDDGDYELDLWQGTTIIADCEISDWSTAG